MKTINKKPQAKWHVSAIDPDVEYFLQPLDNRMRSHITVGNAELGDDDEGAVIEGGGMMYDAVGFGLLQIKGLIDEEGKEFPLTFKNRKIGRNTNILRVTDECISLLPSDIYDELVNLVWGGSRITKAEKENMDFTTDSCSQPTYSDAQTVTDVSPPADGSEMDNSELGYGE